jgi:hypothetical protein
MPDASLVVVEPPARRRVPRAVHVLIGLAVSGWLGFVLLAGVLLFMKPSLPGAAGGDGPPRLLAGPVMVAEPWTETALPIQLGPARSIPRGSWIRISGMPALASLSAGYTIGGGVWKVPAAALSALTITAPTRDSIGSEIRIALMSADGVALAEVQSVLAVMPASMCGGPQVAAKVPLPDDVAPGTEYRPASRLTLPVLTNEDDRQRAQELLLKGEIHRLQGRFESARGYYERAADMGWPRAAMALAATFDRYELKGAIRADVESARAWYRRSRELQNAAVDVYLKRLDLLPTRGELLPTRLEVQSAGYAR